MVRRIHLGVVDGDMRYPSGRDVTGRSPGPTRGPERHTGLLGIGCLGVILAVLLRVRRLDDFNPMGP